jgi:hypothetical protein
LGVVALEWATAQSTQYAWWSFLVPAGYVADSPVSFVVESSSADSTDAAVLTVSAGCVAAGSAGSPTLVAGAPVSVTHSAGSGRVVTSGTVSPACAAGSRVFVSLAVDTAAHSLTAPVDVIGVLFSVQGAF